MSSATSPGFVAGPANRRRGARVLFLDRDGVINVDHGYVHTPEKTEWVSGLMSFLKAAASAGYELVIATNQAGIARGYYSEQTFRHYMDWLHGRVSETGIPVLGTFFCPHHPVAGLEAYRCDCLCRKPRPGMLEAAVARFDIDVSSAIFIGDKVTDMQAASAAGIARFCLLGDDIGEGVLPASTQRLAHFDDVLLD